jgi:hypothetical protein
MDAPSFLFDQHVEAGTSMELRNHPKLRDQWPPQPGGAFAKDFEVPLAGEDILQDVFYYAPVADAAADIALKTNFKGQLLTRDLLLSDSRFAEQLVVRLKQNIGKTIADIAEIPLEF